MDLKSLRYFAMVAREQSFTSAAEKLFVTQPTLSRQIADLEEELGQKLFERNTRRVTLTPKGLFLLQKAEAILAQVEKVKAETMAAEDFLGSITISAAETPAMAILADAIRHFQGKHPQVQFHLLSKNANDSLLDLRAGVSDFGVFMIPTDLTGLEYISLPYANRWGVLVARDSPWAALSAITPDTLKRLLLYVSRQGGADGRFEGWLQGAFSQLHIAGTYNLLYNASLLPQGNTAVLGLEGIVPNNDKVVFIPLAPELRFGVVVVWVKGRGHRPVARAFLEALNTVIEDWTRDTPPH